MSAGPDKETGVWFKVDGQSRQFVEILVDRDALRAYTNGDIVDLSGGKRR
jgi:hypothetical protein